MSQLDSSQVRTQSLVGGLAVFLLVGSLPLGWILLYPLIALQFVSHEAFLGKSLYEIILRLPFAFLCGISTWLSLRRILSRKKSQLGLNVGKFFGLIVIGGIAALVYSAQIPSGSGIAFILMLAASLPICIAISFACAGLGTFAAKILCNNEFPEFNLSTPLAKPEKIVGVSVICFVVSVLFSSPAIFRGIRDSATAAKLPMCDRLFRDIIRPQIQKIPGVILIRNAEFSDTVYIGRLPKVKDITPEMAAIFQNQNCRIDTSLPDARISLRWQELITKEVNAVCSVRSKAPIPEVEKKRITAKILASAKPTYWSARSKYPEFTDKSSEFSDHWDHELAGVVSETSITRLGCYMGAVDSETLSSPGKIEVNFSEEF